MKEFGAIVGGLREGSSVPLTGAGVFATSLLALDSGLPRRFGEWFFRGDER